MPEVLTMLEEAGFKPVEFYYSAVNDLTYVDAEPEDYKRLRGYAGLLKLAIKKPTKLNLLRAAAYPLVKLIPSLRMLIVAVSQSVKSRHPRQLKDGGKCHPPTLFASPDQNMIRQSIECNVSHHVKYV